MNLEQEDFETLRKILALKKYEQPPPRYFAELPGRIWDRLERAPAPGSFWARLFPKDTLPPALGYSFGLMACGALFFGVAYTLNVKTPPTAQPFAHKDWPMTASSLAVAEKPLLNVAPENLAQLASTNPVMNPSALPSIFDRIKVQTAPVIYSP